MTLHLPMLRLLTALLLASPAAAARRSHKAVHEEPDQAEDCLRLASRDEVLAGTLLSGPLGTDREFASVRFTGARSFPDDLLWDLVGGKPGFPLSRDKAVALVARIAQSGIFASVEPRSAPREEGQAPELEIELAENPRVHAVEVRGLSEFRTEDIVERLLDAPSSREVERRLRELHDARPGECPAPLPPRSWLARTDDGEVRAGVIWQGLPAALRRAMRYLHTRGYPLASVEGELSPFGELILQIDEGHVGGVEVRGLDSRLAREVKAELAIGRGDVFSSGDLYSALERVQRKWPFVRADRRRRPTPPAPDLHVEPRVDGGVKFHSGPSFEPMPPPPAPSDDDDDEIPAGPKWPPKDWDKEWDDDDFDFFESDPPPRRPRDEHKHTAKRSRSGKTSWYGLEGDRLIIYLHTELVRSKGQWEELIRHTPVTGFAPGFAMTLNIYDPGDRTHLMLDGAVNINTRRHDLEGIGGTYLERLSAQQHVDWLAGTRLRFPALDVAELGAQIHNLTDTADRWRISAIDSYLYSALINRSDREYYHRSGFASFLTFHFFEELTLAGEYRRDHYAPLDVPGGVWSVWNSGEVLYGSSPVDAGEMGSVVARLEYHSEKTPLHRVGSMWRNSETSLVGTEAGALGLNTLNTFEVADPKLGGDFKFTRIVSDTSLTLETGRHSTVTLRLRGAGGHDLPLQKQEGLGGWTALRGYDFKEFRGNASLLGTLQAEGKHFGAFFDLGSVHQAGSGWIDPKPAVGALFSFAEGSTRVEAAWRLDSHSRWEPEIRVLFSVPR